MAQVTIGGAPITVVLPNFKALKAAWRYIAAVQNDIDPMAGVEAILGLVSVGAAGETLSVDQLETRLRPSEIAGLRPFINDLMVEIGLAPAGDSASGEALPAKGEASPSTAISTP